MADLFKLEEEFRQQWDYILADRACDIANRSERRMENYSALMGDRAAVAQEKEQ